MSDSRKKGLLRLRHLNEVTEAVSEEMDAQRGRFERLKDPGSAPRVVTSDNLFQTPEPLAARLARMFQSFGRTLEPSAGLGRLYRAVRAVDATCPMTLVDISADCCRELYVATEGDDCTKLVQGDFLEMTVERLGGPFDSIIMNAPFRNGADIKHTLHAYEMLAKGGRLVAICAGGERRRKAFERMAVEWIDLPAKSFKEAYTNVDAAIVVLEV